MQPKFRVEPLFSTPLVIAELKDAEAINAQLEAAIFKRREEHPGLRRSNVGGWHSAQDLLVWGGEAAGVLARTIGELATANTQPVASAPGGGPKWAIEGWANVNENGSFNAAHYHGGNYWAAVYYVRVDPGKGGGLNLQDPRLPGLVMYAPQLRFRNAGPQHATTIQPRPGLLLLFPAWLSHSVLPYEGEGMRISLGFNVRVASR